MARSEAAVFTNMCMVYNEQGQILVQDRKKQDWPGITFPGGHVEKGESFVGSVIREVKEETGLTIQSPQLCGVKQFQDKQGARYVVMLYKTNHFSGTLHSSAEGEVYWINRHELLQLPLADDFAEMIAVFEKEDLSECFYEQTTDASWQLKLF